MEKTPVSLVVITLNEEKNIERCLRSAPFVDDIVVVDSGSTDRTCEIAESLGARVYKEEWRGYYRQKVRATELAKHDWILSLDADEGLSPDLSAEIEALLNSELPEDGFNIPRLSYHMGRWIHHGGWYPDAQIRFFHRSRCHWKEGNVHERLVGDNVRRLKAPIYHWVFEDIADQVDTNNEYSTLGAQDLADRGKNFSLLKLIFKPYSKFIETYILKRGFMDGLPGFIISVGAAYSVFLKFAKLWEMKKMKSKS